MNATYTAQQVSTSGRDAVGHVSSVPERFRSKSSPDPGRSAVREEFRSSSTPRMTPKDDRRA
jgi:hypothetical protein